MNADFFDLKVMFLDAAGTSIAGVVPVCYPAGRDLATYVKTLAPHLNSSNLTFFTDKDEEAVDSISKGNPRCYRVLCNIGSDGRDTSVKKAAFLESVDDNNIRQQINVFLFPEQQLESLTTIVTMNYHEFVKKNIISYQGVTPLKIVEKQIEFMYHNETLVHRVTMDFEKQEFTEEAVAFFSDIASRRNRFDFEKIRAITEKDGNILVDHVRRDAGAERRELRTFQREEKNGTLAYKDTGNRIHEMSLLEDVHAEVLDAIFVMEHLSSQTEKANVRIILRNIEGEMCDVIRPGTTTYYFLVWNKEKKEGLICGSVTEERVPEEPLLRFRIPSKPKAFVYLETMNAFLLSVTGEAALYLVEATRGPDEVEELRDVTKFFQTGEELFSISGQVVDFYAQPHPFHEGRECLLLAQEQRIALFMLEEMTYG